MALSGRAISSGGPVIKWLSPHRRFKDYKNNSTRNIVHTLVAVTSEGHGLDTLTRFCHAPSYSSGWVTQSCQLS